MDTLDFINTITSNNYADWIRCHNDMLHSIPEKNDKNVDPEDQAIRIISHILKLLYNDKISFSNKSCLLISIEENLEYFIRSKAGAINFFQSLFTDFKNRVNLKCDTKYLCQVINVLCVLCVYFDLPKTENDDKRCINVIENFIEILMQLCCVYDIGSVAMYMKHTCLVTLLHLENSFPTLLLSKKTKIWDLLQNEKTVFYDLELQLFSLIFKNDILNRCRIQQDRSYLNLSISKLSENINDSVPMRLDKFKFWNEKLSNKEKLVGSQGQIFKTTNYMIEQCINYLTTLGMKHVILNTLTIMDHVVQSNSGLFDVFLRRYSKSTDLNIIETLFLMKTCRDPLIIGDELQETILSIINNSQIGVPKRLMAGHWLYKYPISRQDCQEVGLLDIKCKLEPELIGSLFLRSFDNFDIKYMKLMLLSKMIVTSEKSDASSAFIFSSMKNLIKHVQFYNTTGSSNILFRVMFNIHILHNQSVVVRDFETILESLVTRKENNNNIMQIIVYLNALVKYQHVAKQNNYNLDTAPNNLSINDEHSKRQFSSRCLHQISKLSSDKLEVVAGKSSYDNLWQHLQILNCAIKLCDDMELTSYINGLTELLVAAKMDISIDWLDQAYNEILKFCFNVLSLFDCFQYYKELINILFEIQTEHKAIEGKFLYTILVSLPSCKVREVIQNTEFDSIDETNFDVIVDTLITKYLDSPSFIMTKNGYSTTNPHIIYSDKENFSVESYYKFLSANIISADIPFIIQPKENLSIEMDNILLGISIDFVTNQSDCTVNDWITPIILGIKDWPYKQQIKLSITYPSTFHFSGRLSATKLDGTFLMYSVECENIDFIDLCLPAPLDINLLLAQSNSLAQNYFIDELIDQKLTKQSFVSINFKNELNYTEFSNHFDRFKLKQGCNAETRCYLLFLPSQHHIFIEESNIGEWYRRFDLYTDLRMYSLLELEKYLKTMNNHD